MPKIVTRVAPVKGADYEALDYLTSVTIHVPVTPFTDATVPLVCDMRWFIAASGMDASDYFETAVGLAAYMPHLNDPSTGEFWLRHIYDLPLHVWPHVSHWMTNDRSSGVWGQA